MVAIGAVVGVAVVSEDSYEQYVLVYCNRSRLL